jgi:hypothetical protein
MSAPSIEFLDEIGSDEAACARYNDHGVMLAWWGSTAQKEGGKLAELPLRVNVIEATAC